MTSPLFWKGLELSNKVFSIIIKYPIPVYICSKTRKYYVEKNPLKLIPFCLFFLVSYSQYVSLYYILFACLIIKTQTIDKTTLMFTAFLTFLMADMFTLMGIVLRYSDVLCIQFFNNLFSYENYLTKLSLVSVREYNSPTLIFLLKSGITYITSNSLVIK